LGLLEPIPKTLAACNRLFCSLAASEKRQNILKYAAIFLPCQPAKLLDFGDAHVFGIGSSNKISDIMLSVIERPQKISFRKSFEAVL